MNAIHDYIRENRLIRHAWTGTDAEGRETACLLAALSPKVRKTHSPRDCPASLISPALAHLTPWIDDAGTLEHWPAVVRRYADLIDRTHVLDADAWLRLDREWCALAVERAVSYVTVDEWGVRDACAGMARALRAGGDLTAARAAADAAWAVARVAAGAAAEAAGAAAEAAGAAALAARAAAEAAARAAGDRLIDAILDAWEVEIAKKEKGNE